MEKLKKNKELKAEFDKHCLTAIYPTGTKIGGRDLHAIPYLISGLLKVTQTDSNGNSILLYYIQPNQACIFSMLQGYIQEKSQIEAVVVEESEIMFIPVSKANEWMLKYPEWTEYIMNSYYQRFSDLLKALNSASAEKLETRVLKYLRQRRHLANNRVLSITHQNMASDLSTNRVVISRLLKTLENRGLVKLGRNKIEVTEAL